ncbi:MAG TPA: GNAT family N-acetyltransferase [Gammaproteobacteria bacterium]|nr:GNAT family N-acetyltransferase [Gammaproteobacteria bacterium]
MIRPAELADLDALVALEERCFEADRLDRGSLRHALASLTMLGLVDEDRDQVRGYVLLRFRRQSTQVRILSLAVDPDARRQGVARALLKEVETAAQEQGVTELILELREDNAVALALYRSLGFDQTGTLLAYYHDKSDALRLSKPLSPAARARADEV